MHLKLGIHIHTGPAAASGPCASWFSIKSASPVWAPLLLTSQVLWEAKGSARQPRWTVRQALLSSSNRSPKGVQHHSDTQDAIRFSQLSWHLTTNPKVRRLTNLMQFKEISVPRNGKQSVFCQWTISLTVFHWLPLSALLLCSAFTFLFYSYYKVGCVCRQVCQKRFWIRAEEISEVSRTAGFNSLCVGAVYDQKWFLDQPYQSWTPWSGNSFEKGISDTLHLSRYDLK